MNFQFKNMYDGGFILRFAGFAAQDGPHACDHDPGTERLGNIVVGAELQTGDA
jgi:hypothetical protein